MLRSKRAVRVGLALALLAATITVTRPATAAPATGQYASYAYLAVARKGSAVYVNALVKQGSAAGIIRSPHRTVYLQRNVNGSWQNMLSRITDWHGLFAVGFISVPDYRYRLVVTASGSALGTTSAVVASTTPPPVVSYANCTAMHARYPHGVGRSGAVDHTSGTPVLNFFVDTALYNANTGLDRDRDGIACEQH